MFLKLLKHSFLAYRRAHFFEKSLYIKLLIGFVVFTLLFYVLMIGMALPGILYDAIPEQKPHDVIFSVLVFIMLGDLLTRWFIQKIPSQKILPYLHYPISKNSIAKFFLIRAWFNIFNFYLLVFFVPFFGFTIAPNYSVNAFILTLAGILILSGVNHSLIILLKTSPAKNNYLKHIVVLLILVFVVISWFHTEQVLRASQWLGNSFMEGQIGTFVFLIALISFLQTQAKKNLKKSFYHLIESGSEEKILQKSTLAERLFAKLPLYGKYWNLEWKLINRNKRAKSNLYQWPVSLLVLMFIFWWYADENIIHIIAILILFVGSYGFLHLQYFLSWESRFFDFLASRKVCFYEFFKAKFYFYSLMALIQFLILLPFIIFIEPLFVLVYLSTMLYTTGVAFCIMMYTGINHSTRINPNAKAFLNFEGISGNQFLMILLVLFSIIPFIVIGHIIPLENGTYWSLMVAGIIFWVLHPVWIKKIADNFNKRRHIKLEKFRHD